MHILRHELQHVLHMSICIVLLDVTCVLNLYFLFPRLYLPSLYSTQSLVFLQHPRTSLSLSLFSLNTSLFLFLFLFLSLSLLSFPSLPPSNPTIFPPSLSAVELNYGTLYCYKCRDYIYDASLDEVSRSIDQQLAHKNYHISRQPVAYVAWEPTNDEIDLLKKNPKRKRVEPGSTIGECSVRK